MPRCLAAAMDLRPMAILLANVIGADSFFLSKVGPGQLALDFNEFFIRWGYMLRWWPKCPRWPTRDTFLGHFPC